MGEDGKPGRVSPRKNAVTRADLAASGRSTHKPYNKEYRSSHQRDTPQAHQPAHTHTQLTSAQYRALSNCRRFSTQRAQHDTIHGRRGAVIVHTTQYNCSAKTTQAAYMGADLLDVLLLLAQQRVEVLLVHDLHVRLCAQQGRTVRDTVQSTGTRKRHTRGANYIYTGSAASDNCELHSILLQPLS
jgi:hypothetical protein